MRSTFGLAFVLGLLTSLTVATTDTGIVSDLPVFSTLESCFYLITQDNFTVDLQLENTDEYVPILSRAPIRLPEFKLTDGNLTTADGKFSAFLGPTSRIFPPPLIPLGFARGVPFLVTEFAAVAETIPSGIDVLRLVALEGRELK